MKIDKASSVEPPPSQNTVTSSSATMTGNSKVSKFRMKTGFVIPKNKLSGSLVPAFRGAGKVETDTVKEETNKQIQRKTKWGTDLTQDATVRKGRAIAYQTRVEQITKQLKSGVSEKVDDDLSPQSPNQIPNNRDQVDEQAHKLEMLELEKREVIGEILKLNPSYKAPPDYKPLMKEAIIPVPAKLYPGLNFVGLILGPGSNTQKRLEEETGARIQIQGTKAGSTEKVEITSSDNNDVQGAYEELSVHVSADTFEKVDAAVSLIELLVTPLSGNSEMVSSAPASLSSDSVNVLQQSQNATSAHVTPGLVFNQGVQPMMPPMQHGLLPQGQYQPYPTPWFASGLARPPNNFGLPPNTSAPVPNNVIQFPSPSQNPSNMPQFWAGHPPSAAGSALAPRNPSLGSPRLQPPMQGYQWPYFHEAPPNNQGPPPRIHPNSQHPYFPAQQNPAVPHQGTNNQPRTTGPFLGPGPTSFSSSQPISTVPSGQPPRMLLTSSGWSTSTVGTPSHPVQFQRPPVHSQPLMTSGTVSSNVPANVRTEPSGNMASPASFPPRPSTTPPPNTLVNHPVTGPNFSFVVHQRSPHAPTPVPLAPAASMPPVLPSNAPSPTMGPMQAPSMVPRSPAALPAFPRVQPPPSSPSLNQSSPVAPHMQPVGPQGPTSNQSMVGAAPVPQTPPSALPQLAINPNSISASLPNLTSPKPPLTSGPQTPSIPATTPKPHRPSSGDFTFQPLGSSQTIPRPNNQPSQTLSAPPTSVAQPPPPPQTPSFRPAMQNPGPGFPSNQPNQIVQSQSQVRSPSLNSGLPFPSNPTSVRPPPRFPEFANQNPFPPAASSPRMGPGLGPGPQNFTQAPPPPNFAGRYPQMTNPPQMQHNQLNPAMRPGTYSLPNQQYSNNPNFSAGRPASIPSGNQVYDPFSPTSVHSAPQQPETPAKVRKQEDDPEYDDLMASVGVR